MARKPVKKTDGAHNHNYGFVFSDRLEDWQHSKRLKANEYVKKKYWESKRATV